MAGHRGKVGNSDRGARSDAETTAPPDFGAWSQSTLAQHAGDLPEEELAAITTQLRVLATEAPTAGKLPPDPGFAHIVRNRKALKQLGTSLSSATEAVVDLETSSLNPRDGEIVGVGLATGDANHYVLISHRFQLRPAQLPLEAVMMEIQTAQYHSVPAVGQTTRTLR